MFPAPSACAFPGSYSVMCKPSGGAIKSKTVSVRSGETAMATFKL